MKFNWRVTMVFMGLAVALTGCEIKKTADDMKRTTRRVEDSSKHLEKRTDDLHNDMTYKESDETMTKRLAMIFGDTAEDNVGVLQNAWNYFFGLSNEPDLFKFAGVTMLSMHWQFWKGDYNDNMKELDSRMYWAVESLFLGTFKHTPRDGDVDVLRPDRSFRGVAALGSKLDMVSDRMHDVLSARGMPDSIFYDMIVRALRTRGKIGRDEQFPRAVDKVQQWEKEATYMLQLRHNIYPVMVVTRLTDIVERGDLGRLWMAKAGYKVSSAELAALNPATLRELTVWLDKASATRRHLYEASITPRYNRMLADIVAGVDFGQKEILARGVVNDADERAKLLYNFAAAYDRVVKESARPVHPGRFRQGPPGSGGGRRR